MIGAMNIGILAKLQSKYKNDRITLEIMRNLV